MGSKAAIISAAAEARPGSEVTSLLSPEFPASTSVLMPWSSQGAKMLAARIGDSPWPAHCHLMRESLPGSWWEPLFPTSCPPHLPLLGLLHTQHPVCKLPRRTYIIHGLALLLGFVSSPSPHKERRTTFYHSDHPLGNQQLFS